MIVEVVSPRTRKVDVVDKFEIFHELAIPHYIILDRKRWEDPWDLRGYQYAPLQFTAMSTTTSSSSPRTILPSFSKRLGLTRRSIVV